MHSFRQHIIRYLLCAALTALGASCSAIYDEPAADEPQPLEAGMVSLNFSVPKATAADGAAPGAEGMLWGDTYNKEAGTSYDLAVNTDMLHLAVYDAAGSYKGEISKLLCFKNDGAIGSDKYTYVGELPDGLSDGTTYRVMAFANAPGYTDADSYGAAASNFDMSQLQPDKGIVPMWGVISGQFQTGKRTDLPETLQLLRAVSKTYVSLDQDTKDAGFKLTSVKLTLPVSEGKIVPDKWKEVDKTEKVYFRDDPANVFAPAYNPVTSGTSRTQDFYQRSDGSYVVYTPEYSNTKGDAVINFTISSKDGKDYTINGTNFELRYRDYTKETGAYFDIARNHIYTFEIKIDTNSGLFITVREWFAAYDNNFVFGSAGVNVPLVKIEDWTDDGGGILVPAGS